MTVINTNTAAINAQYNLSKVQSAMDDAMSALSSGKRINSGMMTLRVFDYHLAWKRRCVA